MLSSQWPQNLPFKLRLKLSLYAAINSTGFGSKLLSVLSEAKSDPSPTTPINSVLSSDITVDSHRSLWFRLFLPSATSNLSPSTPIIVYFHGGGFRNYAPDTTFFDSFCRNLSRQIHAVVVSVNYRLTPFFRYPCQYDDGFDVLKFLDSPEFRSKCLNVSGGAGLSLRRCFLAGDSAGGNIAHHLAVRASEYKFSNIRLIGLIQLMPFFGGVERTDSEMRLKNALMLNVARTDQMWKLFLPEGADRDHGAANVMGPNGVDLSGVEFPTTFVICGAYDPLHDWDMRYCEWLEKCGKEVELKVYENAFHGFYCFEELPDTKRMLEDVKAFVDRQVAESGN